MTLGVDRANVCPVSSPINTRQADLLILLAAAIWGIAFYFQKTAMTHIGPLLFLGLRTLIAVLALLPFALREQRKRQETAPSVAGMAAIGGLIFFLAAAIQQYGIVTTTVINTGFLTALYVIATPFAYWAIERQRPTQAVWLSATLAFFGVWGLSGGSLTALSTGDMLVALGAVFWGLHMVVVGKSGRLAQPLTFTCLQFGLVACIALALALTLEPINMPAIVAAADSILYVGLLSSALTFGVMAIALQHVPAPRASIVLSTEVLFSAAAGYLLLGERLTLVGWTGGLAIIAAILVVRLRDK